MTEYIFYGGAFDPPHVDHVNKAIQVLDATGCPRLYFMPTYKHIWGKKMVDWPHRLRMLRKSINDSGDNRLWIDAYECVNKISGPTIDTLKGMFKSELWNGIATPKNSAYLIGVDQAFVMHKWERWEELTEFIPFIVMSRRDAFGYDKYSAVECTDSWFLKPPHRYIKVALDMGASSSIIRHSIREHIAFGDYLTPSTLAYIKEHELYR